MQQSGFLYKFDPRDYKTGASPLGWDVLVPSGDWRPYVPSDEKQHNLTFDTMSCTTFSALNVIEFTVNYFLKEKKLSASQLATLTELGFIENGRFNASDRFTAIMSGTMPNGNYAQNVMDSVRKDGLLAEKYFPFQGNSWAEYHDKLKITEAMKVKAKKILDIFDFAYEWVPVNSYGTDLAEALKQSPVQVAVTKESPTHMIMLPHMEWEYETYEPHLRKRNRTIAYAMKIQVKAKTPPPTYTYFSQAEVAQWKLKPEMWTLLDKIRGEFGYPIRITSGLRTQAENDALKDSVSDSAHLSGLACDIFCIYSDKRFKLIDVARKNGVNRIGVGKGFIHLDIDPTKPKEVMWTYY